MTRCILVTGSAEAPQLRAALEARGVDVVATEAACGLSLPQGDVVLDASHPCEAATQRRVAERAAHAGLRVLRFRRPAWTAADDDRWIDAVTSQDARAALDPGWRRVFLCLGRSERAPFLDDASRRYLVRTRPNAHPPDLPPNAQTTPRTGPVTAAQEEALMRRHEIDVLVTRNAGGEGAFPKIAAARALGLPVVLVQRPSAPGEEVNEIGSAVAWVERALQPGFSR